MGTYTNTITIPYGPTGWSYVGTVTDRDDDITDDEEYNNTAYLGLKIRIKGARECQ
jgi:hypothetical protein